jgi:hypothetical protein
MDLAVDVELESLGHGRRGSLRFLLAPKYSRRFLLSPAFRQLLVHEPLTASPIAR